MQHANLTQNRGGWQLSQSWTESLDVLNLVLLTSAEFWDVCNFPVPLDV